MPLGGQLMLDIVDGEVLLAHRHHQFPDWVARGCGLGPGADLAEEVFLELWGGAELVTQDPESTGGIAETARCFGRGQAFDEIGQYLPRLVYWRDVAEVRPGDRRGTSLAPSRTDIIRLLNGDRMSGRVLTAILTLETTDETRHFRAEDGNLRIQ